MNSRDSITECLSSLRASGVGQLIVVDARSTDGTREIAQQFADLIVEDPGLGLGLARNFGIRESTGALVLNLGSDNILPAGALEQMIQDLDSLNVDGVSAQTQIQGNGFISRGLNAWRAGRFRPGYVSVIGTPTLFVGDRLRANPFDPEAIYSDDSELCERWSSEFDARFAISTATVQESGKATWREVRIRCRMYGISDFEIYSKGCNSGWKITRRLKSIQHPLKADLITPLLHLPIRSALANTPFLLTFTSLRYFYWSKAAVRHNKS